MPMYTIFSWSSSSSSSSFRCPPPPFHCPPPPFYPPPPLCPPPFCPPSCPPPRPPPRQFFLRKSNTHAYTSDWCAFALDGVKNVTDGQGVSRSRIVNVFLTFGVWDTVSGIFITHKNVQICVQIVKMWTKHKYFFSNFFFLSIILYSWGLDITSEHLLGVVFPLWSNWPII